MKTMLPRGVLLMISGSWWRRALELDARQEASKRVAAAPVAIGFVVALWFDGAFSARQE
jgi:hypothetical protein